MDIAKFAAAFGVEGYRIDNDDDMAPTLKKAMVAQSPAIVDLRVDYSANAALVGPIRCERIRL